MSARAMGYQTQIAGHQGQIFRLNGVKFDGYSNGVLFEAKGPGYARFISNGEFRTWFNGYKGLIEQASRQIVLQMECQSNGILPRRLPLTLFVIYYRITD